MLIGCCAHRLGLRTTMILADILLGGGTYLGRYVTELWHVYALYGGLTAIGMGGACALLVATNSRWTENQSGLAIKIATIGG